MARTSRTVPILAALTVLLAATAFVPNAQATSVDWVLTNASQDGYNLLSVNTESHGTQDSLHLGSPITWQSYVAADESLDLGGTWTYQLSLSNVNMDLISNELHITLSLGTVSPSGSFDPQIFDDTIVTPSDVDQDGNVVVVKTIPPQQFVVSAGDHLGAQVFVQWGSASVDVTPSDSPDPSSFLQSPDSDPNFPVWELGSLALLGAGLVVVAGAVHTRRRNRD